MKGRPVPAKKHDLIVTIVYEGDSSWVCLYINDAYFGDGEVEGFYLGELLEQAGAHVHYLNTFGLVQVFGDDWPKTLTETLTLPVWWEVDDGAYRKDPVRTLASINQEGVIPTPLREDLASMASK